MIAVAATDRADNRAYFSSTGTKVELAAPGVDITSTYLNGGYAIASGTSRASLHVAGVAALVFGCGLTTRTTYTYKVFAVNGSSVSAASNTLSVKTK